MQKQSIFNLKRARMHLDCAIAHLQYCDGDIIPKNKQQIISDALFDFNIIKALIDKRINTAEMNYISEDNN